MHLPGRTAPSDDGKIKRSLKEKQTWKGRGECGERNHPSTLGHSYPTCLMLLERMDNGRIDRLTCAFTLALYWIYFGHGAIHATVLMDVP